MSNKRPFNFNATRDRALDHATYIPKMEKCIGNRHDVPEILHINRDCWVRPRHISPQIPHDYDPAFLAGQCRHLDTIIIQIVLGHKGSPCTMLYGKIHAHLHTRAISKHLHSQSVSVHISIRRTPEKNAPPCTGEIRKWRAPT